MSFPIHSEKNFILAGDYDSYGWPQLRTDSELLEIVRFDVKRLHCLRPDLGRAVIKRTWNGWHLRFPFSELSREEVDWLSNLTHMDTGYLWWLQQRGKATLRQGIKVIATVFRGEVIRSKKILDIPQIIEIIEVNPK